MIRYWIGLDESVQLEANREPHPINLFRWDVYYAYFTYDAVVLAIL